MGILKQAEMIETHFIKHPVVLMDQIDINSGQESHRPHEALGMTDTMERFCIAL